MEHQLIGPLWGNLIIIAVAGTHYGGVFRGDVLDADPAW
jgi:hypothetical protein